MSKIILLALLGGSLITTCLAQDPRIYNIEDEEGSEGMDNLEYFPFILKIN